MKISPSRRLLFIGLFFQFVNCLDAQISSMEKLPDGPLIQKIPTNAAWTITVVSPEILRPQKPGGIVPANTNSTATPVDKSEIVKWSFRRSGKVANLEMLSFNGGTTSIWALSPSLAAVRNSGDKTYHIVEFGDELSELGYGNNSFPHTSLVIPQNYAGRLAVNGALFLLFRKGGENGVASDSGMVLIDEKTRFPYGAIENQKGFLFSIQPSLSTIVPPSEVIKVFQNENARLNRLNAVPPHP